MKRRNWIVMTCCIGIVLCGNVTVQADYTDGLVARWTFDDADPNDGIMDDVGANSSLIQSSGVSVANGQAVFDGTVNSILTSVGVGADDELNITPDITLWMRVNITDYQTIYTRLFSRRGDDWVQRPYFIDIASNGFFTANGGYEGWDGSQIVRRFMPAIYSGLYPHFGSFADIAFVWNSQYSPGYGRGILYINGGVYTWAQVAHEPPATAGIWSHPTVPFKIGPMLGTVEEARVYNRALTTEQIAQIEYSSRICGDAAHPYPIGDISQDCYVNIDDFALLAANWLECTDPELPCNYNP